MKAHYDGLFWKSQFWLFWVNQVLFHRTQLPLRNIAKGKWETENYIVTFPTLEVLPKNNQYSLQGGLCYVGYIRGHSSNNHPYGLFTSSGVEEHAYNFGPPHWSIITLKMKKSSKKQPLLSFKI